jgi:hypothetical protein
MPTESEILQALKESVERLLAEDPSIGVQHRMELAVSGRLGILLGRLNVVQEWEIRDGVNVDVEYSQAGNTGDLKRAANVHGNKRPAMRPDLLIRHRGDNSRNGLAAK